MSKLGDAFEVSWTLPFSLRTPFPLLPSCSCLFLLVEILKRQAMSNQAQTRLLRRERTQSAPQAMKSIDERDQILVSSRVSHPTIDADRRSGCPLVQGSSFPILDDKFVWYSFPKIMGIEAS